MHKDAIFHLQVTFNLWALTQAQNDRVVYIWWGHGRYLGCWCRMGSEEPLGPHHLLHFSHSVTHWRHISFGPQPNYSTTRFSAIKCGTAGVWGSCSEPGCCHGHCHSADYWGWEGIYTALQLLAGLSPPIGARAKHSQTLFLCNWTMWIWNYWLLLLVKLESWNQKLRKETWRCSPILFCILDERTPCTPSYDP